MERLITEMITRVKLPAAQLQVAMGIPLHHIPEIRELYGQKNRFKNAAVIAAGKSTRLPTRSSATSSRPGPTVSRRGGT